MADAANAVFLVASAPGLPLSVTLTVKRGEIDVRGEINRYYYRRGVCVCVCKI